VVLRHQPATLVVAVANADRHGSCLYVVIPKGFFPGAGHPASVLGISEAGAVGVVSRRWPSASRLWARVILQDPGGLELCRRSSASTAPNTTLNSGRIQIKPEAARGAALERHRDPSGACKPEPREGAGHPTVPAAGAGT